MEWTSIYKTGIDFIDDQHHELFNAVNRIKKISSGAKDAIAKETWEIIEFLEEYVVKHFHDEENYMKSINYPHLDNHRLIHINFINKVGDIKIKLKESGSYNPTQLFITLIKWLQEHIAVEDRKYATYQSIGK